MDVSCPRCETEYELEESKLRPGGVTVKCASCEHVFRVRKRARTDAGMGAPPRPAGSTAPPLDGEERTWLVRLPDGEIKTCRELATLQRWIVSGVVTRECEISRTGKKWKRLGVIRDLQSFFEIADEAAQVMAGRVAPGGPAPEVEGSVVAPIPLTSQTHKAGGHPRAIPRKSAPPQGAARRPAPFDHQETREVSLEEASAPFAATELDTVEMTIEQSEGARRASQSSQIRGRAAPSSAPPERGNQLSSVSGQVRAVPEQSPRSTMHSSAPPAPRPARPGTQPPPPPRSTPSSAPPPRSAPSSAPPRSAKASSSPPRVPSAIAGSPSGPRGVVAAPASSESTGGWAKGADKEWPAERSGPTGPVGGRTRGVPTSDAAFVDGGAGAPEMRDGRFVATDELLRGGTGVHMARRGAGTWIVVVSLFVLAGAGAALYFLVLRPPAEDKVVSGPPDAAAVVEVIVDAAVPPSPDLEQDIAAAREALAKAEPAGMRHFADALTPQPAAAALVLRLKASLAQAESDKAAWSDAADAQTARTASRALADEVFAGADALLAETPDDPEALLAKVDALRLRGAPTREVQRWLKKAESAGADEADVMLARGLLLARDRRVTEAAKLFGELGSSVGKLRLAALDFEAKRYDTAVSLANEVLSAEPDHGTAVLLAQRAQQALTPPEQPPEPAPAGGDGDGDGDGDGGGGEDSYDQLLARGDRSAESGNCAQAMRLYSKALELKPRGVEALTGAGYCHIEDGQYASAQARFRSALKVSSRYQDALWGIAESYQQQGDRAKAVAAYKDFIAKHPESGRAEMARRQIERLGGTVGTTPTPTPDDPDADDADEDTGSGGEDGPASDPFGGGE